jgi:hypothetical protein
VPIYNQIDYILVKQQKRAKVTNARSYAGTTTNSDHRLVVSDITIRPRKYHAHEKASKAVKYNIAQLAADEAQQTKYQQTLDAKLNELKESTVTWCKLKQAVFQSATETVGTTTKAKGKYECPVIEELSSAQKELKLRIYNTKCETTKAKLKRERNTLLHKIQDQAKKIKAIEINAKLQEIENTKDSAKMFQAVRELTRMDKRPIIVKKNDEIIAQPKDAADEIAEYFNAKLNNNQIDLNNNRIDLNNNQVDLNNNQIDYNNNNNKPLTTPITTNEVTKAVKALKNGRAAGPDDMPSELLKYSTTKMHEHLAETLNQIFTSNENLGIGEGTLIALHKEGKPRGQMSSLRPIVLLTCLRKTLSTITLARIRGKVEKFLQPTQSGFRPNRSTTDVVWMHKWLIATTQKHKIAIEILGVDMSSAFDAMDRNILLEETRNIFDNDEWRMIQKLIDGTTLRVRFGNALSKPFETKWGTPQGDCLSPILFTVYLECALKQLRNKCKNPLEDKLFPHEAVYADDVDLISTSPEHIQSLQTKAPAILKEWNLKVNESKLELTKLERSDKNKESWRMTKKLGTLLGDQEELTRRKQLAAASFKKAKMMWSSVEISENKRLRIYNSMVKPVLTYNIGTWALTQSETNELEAFHRKQLRAVLGIHYPERISNDDLYQRTKTEPLGQEMFHARWRMLGHTLRMGNKVPAKRAMIAYFENDVANTEGFVGRPRTTLPITISQDLEWMKEAADERTTQNRPNSRKKTKKEIAKEEQLAKLYNELPNQLKTIDDLKSLEKLANARKRWRQLVDDAHALRSQRAKAK